MIRRSQRPQILEMNCAQLVLVRVQTRRVTTTRHAGLHFQPNHVLIVLLDGSLEEKKPFESGRKIGLCYPNLPKRWRHNVDQA
jgi:hypothetical protein